VKKVASFDFGPVRLTLYPVCSASFFSRNSVSLSQHFNQNSVFQPLSAKFQQAERDLYEVILHRNFESLFRLNNQRKSL